MPMNISTDLVVIERHTLTYLHQVADAADKFAAFSNAHAKAMADGQISGQEAHQLAVLAAVLSVAADRLSRALEAK